MRKPAVLGPSFVRVTRGPKPRAAAGKIPASIAMRPASDEFGNTIAVKSAAARAAAVRPTATSQRIRRAVGKSVSKSGRRTSSTVIPRSPGMETTTITIIARPKRPKSVGARIVARTIIASWEIAAEATWKAASQPNERTAISRYDVMCRQLPGFVLRSEHVSLESPC